MRLRCKGAAGMACVVNDGRGVYRMVRFILLAGQCIFGGVCDQFASGLRLGSDADAMIQYDINGCNG